MNPNTYTEEAFRVRGQLTKDIVESDCESSACVHSGELREGDRSENELCGGTSSEMRTNKLQPCSHRVKEYQRKQVI